MAQISSPVFRFPFQTTQSMPKWALVYCSHSHSQFTFFFILDVRRFFSVISTLISFRLFFPRLLFWVSCLTPKLTLSHESDVFFSGTNLIPSISPRLIYLIFCFVSYIANNGVEFFFFQKFLTLPKPSGGFWGATPLKAVPTSIKNIFFWKKEKDGHPISSGTL